MDLRIFIEPQQGASFEDQLAAAQATEECGFDAFFRSDHLMAFAGDGLPGPTDSWVTLGALARETRRVRLGTMVTSMTFRFPGVLALAVDKVDAMGAGRVEMGLGAGWFDGEHLAHAIPFPPLGQRLERLDEQLQILRGLWATPVGERFSFKGGHYTVVDSPGLPKPMQRPHPPIIIGGAGARRTPALAARYADEFNVPFHSVADFTKSVGRVKKACEDEGRDPSSLVYSAAVGVDVRANSPEKVVDELSQFKDAGAQRLYLQLLDTADVEQVAVIAA